MDDKEALVRDFEMQLEFLQKALGNVDRGLAQITAEGFAGALGAYPGEFVSKDLGRAHLTLTAKADTILEKMGQVQEQLATLKAASK